MKITVKMDEKSERAFHDSIQKYMRIIGRESGEIIDETAAETAKRVAGKAQPFGIGQAKMKKFEKSIAKQAHRALWWGMKYGETGGPAAVAAAHQKRRFIRGTVPKGEKPQGKWEDGGFAPQDRHDYVDKAMQRAGMEKAAWLDAGRKSWSKLVIPKFWIPKLRKGYANKSGEGLKRKVEIGVEINYSTLNDASFKRALRDGRKTMLKKMITAIRKAEQAANRT